MAPPFFSDLGKACSEIFSKGYPIGLWKVDANIGTCGNANIGVGGAIKLEDWSLDSGAIDCKYDVQPPRYKTTVGESWSLDNSIKLAITNLDFSGYVPGLKLAAVGSVNPDTQKALVKFNPSMKTNYASIELGGEMGDEASTALTGSVCTGYGNLLAGAKGNLNLAESKLENHTIGIGVCCPEVQINGFCDDLETYRVSIWHRTNDRLEVGVQAAWKPGNPPAEDGPLKPSSETGNEFEFGARVLVSPFTAIRGKVNVDSQIGVGLESKLREGTILTLAAQIDGKSLSGGNHKFGLGLEFS